MPQWFRQKPKPVQAHLWQPDDLESVGAVVAWIEINGQTCAVDGEGRLAVEMPASGCGTARVIAYPGDWVVRNEAGWFEVMKPSSFAVIYEPVG